MDWGGPRIDEWSVVVNKWPKNPLKVGRLPPPQSRNLAVWGHPVVKVKGYQQIQGDGPREAKRLLIFQQNAVLREVE